MPCFHHTVTHFEHFSYYMSHIHVIFIKKTQNLSNRYLSASDIIMAERVVALSSGAQGIQLVVMNCAGDPEKCIPWLGGRQKNQVGSLEEVTLQPRQIAERVGGRESGNRRVFLSGRGNSMIETQDVRAGITLLRKTKFIGSFGRS